VIGAIAEVDVLSGVQAGREVGAQHGQRGRERDLKTGDGGTGNPSEQGSEDGK